MTEMLDIGKIYQTAGVRVHEKPIWEQDRDEALLGQAIRRDGRFEVLDIDGGVGGVSLWYKVRFVYPPPGERERDGIWWINSESMPQVSLKPVAGSDADAEVDEAWPPASDLAGRIGDLEARLDELRRDVATLRKEMEHVDVD